MNYNRFLMIAVIFVCLVFGGIITLSITKSRTIIPPSVKISQQLPPSIPASKSNHSTPATYVNSSSSVIFTPPAKEEVTLNQQTVNWLLYFKGVEQRRYQMQTSHLAQLDDVGKRLDKIRKTIRNGYDWKMKQAIDTEISNIENVFNNQEQDWVKLATEFYNSNPPRECLELAKNYYALLFYCHGYIQNVNNAYKRDDTSISDVPTNSEKVNLCIDACNACLESLRKDYTLLEDFKVKK